MKHAPTDKLYIINKAQAIGWLNIRVKSSNET